MTEIPEGHAHAAPVETHPVPPAETAPDQIPPEDTVPHPDTHPVSSPEPVHTPPETHPPETHPPETAPPAQIPPEDTVAHPSSDAPATTTAASPVPPESRSRATPWLLGASLLALLVAGYLFWESRTAAGDTAQRLDGLDQRVAALDPRLHAVEARPLPSPPDLRPLQQKQAELDQKLAALDQKLASLDQPMAALDKRLAALDQREAAFEQKPPPPVPLDPPGRAEIAGMAGRIDQLVARQNQIGEAAQADAAKVQDQIAKAVAGMQDQVTKTAAATKDALAKQDDRINAATRTSAQLDTLTSSAVRMTALQLASTALAAGRPLGDVPGAPPALAQFATKPPPTEAALRLSFGDAADAARAAGLPPKIEGALFDRMWARAQSTITVRQGDRVLVGDAISGVLAHAQEQVDAGDLAGGVHTLDLLAGPAAAAMQPWRQQAQALLDARAALLTMAHS